MSRNPAVERTVTIPLIKQASDDLRTAHRRTGLSETDIVNRALTLYKFIDAELQAGGELLVRKGGRQRVITLSSDGEPAYK